MSEEIKTENRKLSLTILVHRALWEQLIKELQETKAQLEKANKLLFEHNNFLYKTSMVFSSSTAFDLCKEFELYREQYFKDKQGSEK